MKAAAACLVVVGLVSTTTTGTQAQDLAQSIARVREGFVRMHFAAREGVCGGNGGVYRSGPRDGHWDPDCDGGPVRIVLEIRAGTIRDIDRYAGGRWRAHNEAVDLGQVPAARAAAYLLSLADYPDEDVASEAVSAAALADSVTVWRDMMSIARNEDIALDVRKTAVFWSGQLGDDTVVPMLVSIVRSETRSDLREHAVFGLSQHDSERATAEIRRFVEDGSLPSNVREKAIFWLGQSRSSSHGYLRDLYETLSDEGLRERVIFAVAQRADEEDWEWLLELAESSSEPTELRKHAIFWAGQSRRDVSDLVRLYDRLQLRELKERVVFVLSQKRDSETALNKLFQIARDEQDSHLRGRAIFWLGQSKDPRAVEFLAELIG